MAYNNGFPATYQPYYYQQPVYQPMQQPAQVTQPSPTNSNLIWVQGEAGAKSYLVAPNNTVQLWDSEKQTIYLKSADASGMPSMKILDYTIRDNAPPAASPAFSQQANNSPIYATKDDLDAVNEAITGLRAEIDSLTIRKAPTKKREVDADE